MDQKNKIFPNKKEKWDFVIAITVILLVGFFVYNVVFKNSTQEFEDKLSVKTEFVKEESYVEENEFYRDEDQLDSIVVSEDDEDKLFSKISEEDDLSKEQIRNKILHIKPFIRPEVFKQTNTEINKVEIIEDSHVAIKENEVIEVEEAIEEENEAIAIEEVFEEENTFIEEEEKEALIESQKEEPVKKEIKKVVANSTNTNCTIVVGAFEEKKNKMKIIDKLKSLGYSHDEGVMNNGLIYVGVPVECSNRSEKTRLINELNRSFNIQSWVKRK